MIQEIKKRKVAEYKIQLAIVENPHKKKPEDLWNLFENMDADMPRAEKFDEAGFNKLKSLLSKGGGFTVK